MMLFYNKLRNLKSSSENGQNFHESFLHSKSIISETENRNSKYSFFKYTFNLFNLKENLNTFHMSTFLPNCITRLSATFVSKKQKSANASTSFTLQLFVQLAVFLFTVSSFAQINNYSFESGTTTYADIAGGTTIVTASTAVGNPSTIQNIGFTFNYLGINYTQFSVNSAGLLRLGSTVVTNESGNNIVSTTNTPKLMPWWDDMYTSAVGSNGGVSFVSSGTAPNRVLTVQWKVTNSNTTNTTVQNFQVKLYETSNKVEYLYGTSNTNRANTASIGLGGIVALSEYLSITSTANGAILSTITFENVWQA